MKKAGIFLLVCLVLAGGYVGFKYFSNQQPAAEVPAVNPVPEVKKDEPSHIKEVLPFLNSIVQSQRTFYAQNRQIAPSFEKLGLPIQGATGNRYFTGGENNREGFVVILQGGPMLGKGSVSAQRFSSSDNLEYRYMLQRRYVSNKVSCGAVNEGAKKVCADFCGLTTPVAVCCNDGTVGVCLD